MPLRVLVAEDIPATREAIVLRLNQHPEIEVIGDFPSVKESVAFLLEQPPVHALFLDIRLKDDYAWQILHALYDRKIQIPPVVLITAEEERGYAETIFNSFRDDVVNYFVKPFGKKWRERNEECIKSIKERLVTLQANSKNKGEILRLPFNTISHLELNEGSSSKIIAVDQITHVVKVSKITAQFPMMGLYIYIDDREEPYYGQQNKTLSSLEQKLSSDQYIKGHRDNLINTTFVTAFESLHNRSFAIAGEYNHQVSLSEKGIKRVRRAMGLLR